ncbi:predicted protein [Sclerotinia sclerotiorum 1980 UF-70]|uniref:Uncharacterized protein n=1 Tax=Sclerotinia sclerotiorum (strain ATCC 18683 / 1980 / Ss-1) TaxID=665079 RepID=A7F9L9_SCLS1|nr:predicted protein [Sclerotinia sclerotiorum 1980 UF-70]EDO00430.1 predicted protein [Sclerotinia sclerotiorum 1980 UF-70]
MSKKRCLMSGSSLVIPDLGTRVQAIPNEWLIQVN